MQINNKVKRIRNMILIILTLLLTCYVQGESFNTKHIQANVVGARTYFRGGCLLSPYTSLKKHIYAHTYMEMRIYIHIVLF